MEYTEALTSPRIFRLWTGIHAVSAVAERKLWTQFGYLSLHPNLYIILVGPPGAGKTVSLNRMLPILRKSQAVNIAPNDITKQSLLDCLAAAGKGVILDGVPFDYHFLALSISELSNFLPKYDLALAGILTDLYDCPPSNEEKKRTHDLGKMIPFPGLSFIIGTATQNLGATVAPEMWGTGFMARIILIYCADSVIPKSRFVKVTTAPGIEDELAHTLRLIGEMKGEMTWTEDAILAHDDFSQTAERTGPVHNRLASYGVRRWAHLSKLCMVSALSDQRMEVRLGDFNRALGWLTEAESFMPEIFKDMISHEDGAIYDELRAAMWTIVLKTHRPIHISVIYDWLSKRVASHQVERIFSIACEADHFRRVAGSEDEYKPIGGGGRSPGTL